MASGDKEGGKSGGFFKKMGAQLTKVGKGIEKGMDSAATSINKTVDEKWKSALLDNFKTGCRVQLVSRTTGKALQCRMGALNALGQEGAAEENKESFWNSLNEGNNIVRLHVDNNYLAIVSGQTVIKHYADPSLTGPETRLRLQQSGQFIMLESVVEPKSHVGIIADGSMKSALATGREPDAQFGVRLIYSPFPSTGKTQNQ